MAQNIVKCSFCGNGVLKTEAERYKNKNYHAECAVLQQQREEQRKAKEEQKNHNKFGCYCSLLLSCYNR